MRRGQWRGCVPAPSIRVTSTRIGQSYRTVQARREVCSAARRPCLETPHARGYSSETRARAPGWRVEGGGFGWCNPSVLKRDCFTQD